MLTLADVRRRARIALILRATGSWSRHPHPGQRYRHGWKPTAYGLTAKAVKAMSDKDLVEAYHDPELDDPWSDKYSDEQITAIVREIGERAAADPDRWLATERRALSNQRRRLAARSRREHDRAAAMDALISQGWTPEDAWAKVTGTDAAKQRAWDLVGRRQGESYDRALRRGYKEAVERQLGEAESVVVGYWLSPEGKRGVARAETEAKRKKKYYRFDPSQLFAMPEAQAEAWASDEAKDFWRSQGGRQTFEAWRSQVER